MLKSHFIEAGQGREVAAATGRAPGGGKRAKQSLVISMWWRITVTITLEPLSPHTRSSLPSLVVGSHQPNQSDSNSRQPSSQVAQIPLLQVFLRDSLLCYHVSLMCETSHCLWRCPKAIKVTQGHTLIMQAKSLWCPPSMTSSLPSSPAPVWIPTCCSSPGGYSTSPLISLQTLPPSGSP